VEHKLPPVPFPFSAGDLFLHDFTLSTADDITPHGENGWTQLLPRLHLPRAV